MSSPDSRSSRAGSVAPWFSSEGSPARGFVQLSLPPPVVDVEWADLSSINSAMKDKDSVVFLGLGVDWNYPSLQSMGYLKAVVNAQKSHQNVAILLNQEANREFCRLHGIMVGIPAVMVYHRGHNLRFRREGWPQTNVLNGPFNEENVKLLIKATTQAISHKTDIFVLS